MLSLAVSVLQVGREAAELRPGASCFCKHMKGWVLPECPSTPPGCSCLYISVWTQEPAGEDGGFLVHLTPATRWLKVLTADLLLLQVKWSYLRAALNSPWPPIPSLAASLIILVPITEDSDTGTPAGVPAAGVPAKSWNIARPEKQWQTAATECFQHRFTFLINQWALSSSVWPAAKKTQNINFIKNIMNRGKEDGLSILVRLESEEITKTIHLLSKL